MTMTVQEFSDAVNGVYDREIASGRSKNEAIRAAETFRSALIKSLAQQAFERSRRTEEIARVAREQAERRVAQAESALRYYEVEVVEARKALAELLQAQEK